MVEFSVLDFKENSLYSMKEGCWNEISYEHVQTDARSMATQADQKKIDQFVARLLIVGLVWNIVCGIHGGWYMIGASFKSFSSCIFVTQYLN